MSHAHRADRLLIKPTAGTRPASPRSHRQIIPKAHQNSGRSPDESHAARRTPGWRRPQTDRPTESHSPLSVGARAVGSGSRVSAHKFVVVACVGLFRRAHFHLTDAAYSAVREEGSPVAACMPVSLGLAAGAGPAARQPLCAVPKAAADGAP